MLLLGNEKRLQIGFLLLSFVFCCCCCCCCCFYCYCYCYCSSNSLKKHNTCKPNQTPLINVFFAHSLFRYTFPRACDFGIRYFVCNVYKERTCVWHGHTMTCRTVLFLTAIFVSSHQQVTSMESLRVNTKSSSFFFSRCL